MYTREYFNMNGNQRPAVINVNNGSVIRPILGRRPVAEQNSYEMNMNQRNSVNNSYNSNAVTSHVMSSIRHGYQRETDYSSNSGASTSGTMVRPITKSNQMTYQREGNASSSSLGLMGMPKPSANKFSTNNQVSNNTKMQTDSQVVDNRSKSRSSGETEIEKLCILTGTVERVIKYGKIFQNHFCYFQVFGSVVSIADGKVNFEKTMLLRDKKGPILQLTYFSNSTHINIEDFYLGQNLRAVGRMIGSNIMSAISIRGATDDEMEILPRLCYISDYSVSALCGDRPFETKA